MERRLRTEPAVDGKSYSDPKKSEGGLKLRAWNPDRSAHRNIMCITRKVVLLGRFALFLSLTTYCM